MWRCYNLWARLKILFVIFSLFLLAELGQSQSLWILLRKPPTLYSPLRHSVSATPQFNGSQFGRTSILFHIVSCHDSSDCSDHPAHHLLLQTNRRSQSEPPLLSYCRNHGRVGCRLRSFAHGYIYFLPHCKRRAVCQGRESGTRNVDLGAGTRSSDSMYFPGTLNFFASLRRSSLTGYCDNIDSSSCCDRMCAKGIHFVRVKAYVHTSVQSDGHGAQPSDSDRNLRRIRLW